MFLYFMNQYGKLFCVLSFVRKYISGLCSAIAGLSMINKIAKNAMKIKSEINLS